VYRLSRFDDYPTTDRSRAHGEVKEPTSHQPEHRITLGR
jgi:hypothetical protein